MPTARVTTGTITLVILAAKGIIPSLEGIIPPNAIKLHNPLIIVITPTTCNPMRNKVLDDNSTIYTSQLFNFHPILSIYHYTL
jgi:hypothetical protein